MLKKIILVLLVIILSTNLSKSQSLVLSKLLNANGALYQSPTNANGFFIKSSIGQLAVEKKVSGNKNDLVIYNGYWSKIGSKVKSDVEISYLPDYLKVKNTPNPFTSQTTINYELVSNAKVVVTVYDMNGNQIAELFNGIQEKGNQTIAFNINSLNGLVLSSGSYLYEVQVSPISFVSEQYFDAYSLRNVMVFIK